MKEVIVILTERTKLHKKLKLAEKNGSQIVIKKLKARLYDFDDRDSCDEISSCE